MAKILVPIVDAAVVNELAVALEDCGFGGYLDLAQPDQVTPSIP